MALTGSGAITLDAMHVEAGGTTGDECSINDADIIGLINKTAGATMAFNEWYGASGEFYDHFLAQSARFDKNGGSANYLQRELSLSNRKTWTQSFWMKLGVTGAHQQIFQSADNNSSTGNYAGYAIDGNGNFSIFNYSNSYQIRLVASTAFRDLSAWYHFVVRWDTTQGTNTNRIRVYANGVQITFNTHTTFPGQNFDSQIGNNTAHHIASGNINRNEALNGYFSEYIMLDGQSLGPDSFGETKNDIWVPIDTSGLTYGNASFKLNFANSSAMGNDVSGRNTDWTASNFGAHDQVPDSPTNNFATLNPIAPDTTGATNHSFSEGSLKVSTGSDSWWNAFGTIGISSGKYYWEYYALGSGSVDQNIGVCTLDWNRGSNAGADSADAYTLYAQSAGNGYRYTDGTSANLGSGYFWTWDDIISVAFDADTGKIWYAKNGTFLGSGDPAAGSNEVHTVTSGDLATGMLPVFSGYHTGGTPVVNFGQDSSFAGAATAQGNADGNDIGDFYYAPPSGFLALCTSNLPDPVAAIDPKQGGSPQDYFNTVLYTGNATARSISGVGFQPDWVWIKERSGTSNHMLFDSVRGAGKRLISDTTNAEVTDTNRLSSFDSDGFSLGTNNAVNENAITHASWNWKAGTAFSNDASATGIGNVDSTGSVNTDIGFSIISYTGTGSAGTIAHGLGVAPEWIIVKRRDSATNGDWFTYVSTIGNPLKSMFLNLTNAVSGDATGPWNNTTPTSSVFSIGTSTGTNASSSTYIAYCFHSVDGFSKVGSYTANANADGPFVYTGFAPAFLMIKNISRAEDWAIVDNRRGVNPTKTEYLAPNNSAAEIDSVARASFVSNGFKIRAPSSYTFNHTSGDTYIYMAFAEQPFKYANAR